ncbi:MULTISPECIES: hypothetical protein [unclassified Variovorax]|uniref:hypothetical protein n=1 Tax=unclassified Variovorax TaxID=663243 RepID=UPI001160BAE2|nr:MULTISPECIES: hypothetical protein [unclassified Variovorax]
MLVSTPLGDLAFQADVEFGRSPVEFSLTDFPFQPALPLGSVVDGCIGVVFKCQSATQMRGLHFECAWYGASPSSGSPASGECLDAQEWSDEKHVVLVGTEDFDILRDRLTSEIVIRERPHPYFIEYKHSGFVITVDQVPAKTSLSLHLLLRGTGYQSPVKQPVGSQSTPRIAFF